MVHPHPTQILTPQSITAQAMKILDEEYEKQRVYSLVEVTIKDGTVLGPIMLELKPRDIEAIQDVIKQGYKVITLTNENESILFPADDITV